MIKLRILLTIFLVAIGAIVSMIAHASDYHQDGQGHMVSYTVTDSSGNPVTGQTIRLSVQRVTDGAFLDFSDNTFKPSGWTTRLTTMSYQSMGEYYGRVVSMDSSALFSSDVVFIVSNDDATYGDMQHEVVNFDNINNLIKIQR